MTDIKSLLSFLYCNLYRLSIQQKGSGASRSPFAIFHCCQRKPWRSLPEYHSGCLPLKSHDAIRYLPMQPYHAVQRVFFGFYLSVYSFHLCSIPIISLLYRISLPRSSRLPTCRICRPNAQPSFRSTRSGSPRTDWSSRRIQCFSL